MHITLLANVKMNRNSAPKVTQSQSASGPESRHEKGIIFQTLPTTVLPKMCSKRALNFRLFEYKYQS